MSSSRHQQSPSSPGKLLAQRDSTMAANNAGTQGFPMRTASATQNGAAANRQGSAPQAATSPSDIYEAYGQGNSSNGNPLTQSVYAGMQSEDDHGSSSYPHFGSTNNVNAGGIQVPQGAQMYPVDMSGRSNQHQAMKPSIDADLSEALQREAAATDNASTHSRARLQSNNTQRARFDSINGLPAGKHAHSSPVQQTDFAEKSGAGKENRHLPAGYSTPPAFSRASSGWSNFGMSAKKGQPQGKHPYGNLGAQASVSDPALQFAQGDYANSKFARAWLMLLSKNIVIRWLVYIIPITALLWIPGKALRSVPMSSPDERVQVSVASRSIRRHESGRFRLSIGPFGSRSYGSAGGRAL